MSRRTETISEIQNQNKFTIKPVFDIAKGATVDFIPFELPKAMQDLTGNLSGSTILTATRALDTITAYQSTSGLPRIWSKQNTIGGFSFGDDTQLETTIFIQPKSSHEITQCFVSAAFAMNISAHTSGNFSFDSLDFEARVYLGGSLTKYETIFKTKAITGHGNLAATGSQIYIFQGQFGGMSMDPKDTLGLYFKMNTTVDTGTRQELLLPAFSWSVTDTYKFYYQSGMIGHTIPSLNAAAQVFKNQKRGYDIDVFGAAAI